MFLFTKHTFVYKNNSTPWFRCITIIKWSVKFFKKNSKRLSNKKYNKCFEQSDLNIGVSQKVLNQLHQFIIINQK